MCIKLQKFLETQKPPIIQNEKRGADKKEEVSDDRLINAGHRQMGAFQPA